ncbi:hypothetical protein KJ654_04625 [Patescibacteria group bacterium]|nr:hypothetical protein [Patescibacteria group bacterium]
MSKKELKQDPYIGITINDYCLMKKVGEGKIGSVYKAKRSNPPDVLACKVMPKLKDGWIKEIEKVVRLRGVPNIVAYHSHGSKFDKNNRQFAWVLWDFIDGINLRQYIEDPPWSLDLAFIEGIAETIFKVLHACRAVEIEHGDLHEGNILISNPDSRLVGSPRTIWISDFGYGGSHNELEPKDDYRQLFAIISSLLRKLDPPDLNPRDKILHQKMNEFLKKKVLEVDRTQGRYVGDSEALFEDFKMLAPEAERESAAATKGEEVRGPGDYLWAEALGYRVDEWKNLFVPDFLAAQDLLSRNITILTGARGCGKTMAFRRITAFMDKLIGEPSGVKGVEQFVGFYVNCRDLVEAFPWLPRRLNKGMQQQIMHYFHLSWFAEICKTLALYAADSHKSFGELDGFLTDIFGDKYHSLPWGADVLAHARAFLENEKERCRLSDLGKAGGLESWPLARVDFLDILQGQLESYVSWIEQKPIYFFLDDYTIPIVTREVQQVLNPIIFKRRNKLFFKVSTESTNSFERQGLHGKPLELRHDFELIDLATESLHQDFNTKTVLLENIFKPRINRHELFKEKNLGLKDVFGKMSLCNNDLAKQMRESGKRALYYGVNAFVGMWASDIRIMIQMFTEMLRDANGELEKDGLPIPSKIQNKIYRATGGEFLESMGLVIDPSLWKRGPSSTKPGQQYGTHLKDIVEAFVHVSRYELTKGDLVGNQGRLNPKQAFRLEIIDKFELPDDTKPYLEGLVRWHIFLQDWRGKSVRGMITPRLYLNRILIPFCNLTFSIHDHIQLTNEEFIDLLKNPKKFPGYWHKKREEEKQRKKNRPHEGQLSLGIVSKGGNKL